jgi:hypothetical protein
LSFAATIAGDVVSTFTNITALVEGGGEITLGHLAAIGKCVATATDDTQCLAMLVRRKGESLDALLQVARCRDFRRIRDELFTDEINARTSSGSRTPRR